MKRNLIIGIVLFGAVALSSCSTTKIASLRSAATDDDVYFTSAKAGDAQNVVADNQMSYNTDDDYYYYGDYASRLNRFTNYSPFSYNDNFYYNYVPYNNGFGAGTEYDRDYYANYYGFGSQPNTGFLSNYVYSPYNYGYDPYDYLYNDYLYDDFGYGLAYSEFLFGGGGGGGSYYYGGGYNHSNHAGYTSTITVPGNNLNARGPRSGSSPGITRISALPGKPVVTINPNTGTITRLNASGVNVGIGTNNLNNTISRQSRDNSYRAQQPQSSNSAPAASSSSSSGGSSAGAGGGGGGGGRPGRP